MIVRKKCRQHRRGAVAAEFALVAPVLLVFVLGLTEMGQALSGATRVSSAIREGGRLASMDFSGKLEVDQTANEKVTQDILSFLGATGISTEDVIVEIVHAEGSEQGSVFDLAAEENYLELFEIRVSVPYENVSRSPIHLMGGLSISANTVFRRGRTPVESE